MKPLTSEPLDQWAVLWSQQKPRRRVDVGYLAPPAETRHIEGDLLIWFVGFDRGANTNEKATLFKVPRLWLQRFARLLQLPSSDAVSVLRDRINSLGDAEHLHTLLWATRWVHTQYRAALERETINQHLAGGRPAFPSRHSGKPRRATILRRELLRSFGDGRDYLTMIKDGYHAACAQVAGVPSAELTLEMCLWAYPEIGVDNWDDCAEDERGEMPFPSGDDTLALASIRPVSSIAKGVACVAYACGDSDLWIAKGADSYGLQPATKTARLNMLQTLADELGERLCGEESVAPKHSSVARRIVDRRPPTKPARKAAARTHLIRTMKDDRGDSEYEIGAWAIVGATAELAGIRQSRVRIEHVRWAFPTFDITEDQSDERGWETQTAVDDIWDIAGGALGVAGVSVGRHAILYANTLSGTDYWFAEGAGCYYIEADDIETRIGVVKRFISTQGGAVHNLFGLPPARVREVLEWAAMEGYEIC